MDESEEPFGVSKADHYRHADGTNEIVYAIGDDVVLSIREYRGKDDFERAIEDAEYLGRHSGVAELPDIDEL